MCSRLKIRGNDINPNSFMVINIKEGTDYKIWGPRPYNARLESLNGYWKPYNRGYILVDAFYEGNGLFTYSPSNEFGKWKCTLAIMYNQHGFAIVTKSSKNTIIEKVHHRMPVLLDKPHDFITSGRIIEINYSKLLKVA